MQNSQFMAKCGSVDKTFYFVGTEAFGQKFRPKQRESDATKNLKNSGNSTLNGWFPN